MRIFRDPKSIILIWGHRHPWAARIVWGGGLMGYTERWSWLAPISMHFKMGPLRDEWDAD